MIVPVFRSVLHHIVVDIGNGEFRFDFVDSHGFQFEVCHGSGCILREGLVDSDCNGFSGHFTAGNDVIPENLLDGGILCHFLSPWRLKFFEKKTGLS